MNAAVILLQTHFFYFQYFSYRLMMVSSEYRTFIVEYSHSKTLGLLQISVLITKLLLNGALTLQFVQFLALEVSLEEN